MPHLTQIYLSSFSSDTLVQPRGAGEVPPGGVEAQRAAPASACGSETQGSKSSDEEEESGEEEGRGPHSPGKTQQTVRHTPAYFLLNLSTLKGCMAQVLKALLITIVIAI